MLNCSFFQEERQLNHVKHKQLPPQVLFATLTHDYQMKLKLVHYLVEHETVRPSLKDECYPGLAHFGNDVIKTLDSFSFDGVHPIEVAFKKPITKNDKTFFPQFFSDSFIEDPVESRKPRDIIPFRSDLVLVLEVN